MLWLRAGGVELGHRVVGRGFVEELKEEGCCCLAVYLCCSGIHGEWIDGSSCSDDFVFFLFPRLQDVGDVVVGALLEI
jgi:hypothetical protein